MKKSKGWCFRNLNQVKLIVVYFLFVSSETSSNGSLNLTFKLINSTLDASVRNKFELIASFKCLAVNAYGKIVSRSAKVYRYNSYNDRKLINYSYFFLFFFYSFCIQINLFLCHEF